MTKTIKEKWEERDEVCQACGQVTKVNRGLTKQNVLKLFRRPTFQDLIILIMLMLTIFAYFAYQSEVAQYKEIIRHPQELCMVYYESILHGNFGEDYDSYIQNITIINTNEE